MRLTLPLVHLALFCTTLQLDPTWVLRVKDACKPLPMVDLRTLEDKGQGNWINECEGMCGV